MRPDPAQTLQPPPPIEFAWVNAIKADHAGPPEIVEDMLTAGGLSIIYGPPGGGKTTVALDLELRMQAELPWLGKQTVKGTAFHLALEGPGSIRARVNAFRKHHGRKLHYFGMVSSSLCLLDGSVDVEDLLELIRCKTDELLTSEPPLRLIVVDTVARTMIGADENSSTDMSRLISACDRIRYETQAHVMLCHHAGNDASKGARGHSSLLAAVDTAIEVSDDGGGLHSLLVTKQRDLGSVGMKLSARFKPVDLGTNQWNKPITACVVEPVEPLSPGLQAIVDANARNAAETAVVEGLRRLLAMGEPATAGKNSPHYLPRKLVEMKLANGFESKDLAAATNDLRLRGVLVPGTVGYYANRTPMPGLVVGTT